MNNKLLSILPKKYSAILDFKEILNATEEQLDDIEKRIIQIKNNNYIQTCDVNQLREFEKLCNLNNGSLTIEERRFLVLNVYASTLPFTMPKLKEQLNSLCGVGNWDLDDSRLSEYIIKITIFEKFDNLMDSLTTALIPYLPAHLQWTIAKNIIIKPNESCKIRIGGAMSNCLTYHIADSRLNKNININQSNSI